MASIKKLPNGRFQATVFVGRDANGKQDKKRKTFDTEKEAKNWARDLEREIEERTYTNMDNMRASAWFDKWMELNQNRLSPSTYLSYKLYVEKHFKPAFGAFKLGQIKELHIKHYINDKLKYLSSTTVRKHILVLREMLRDALKLKSPCRDIDVPKAEKYTPYVLSDTEFQQIHDAVKGTRDEPIVLLSAWCGLRLGEIFALKWDDINWKTGTIRIDENMAISEKGYRDKKPKSDNGIRTIIVPQSLMALLRKYKLELLESGNDKKLKTKSKERKSFKLAFKKATKALLRKYNSKSITEVPEEKKKEFLAELKEIQERVFLMRPDSYSTYFGELIDDKGLPPARFHDLRHYHATWMYNQGILDHYAAGRLGHDIKTLKSIYQHLRVDIKTEMDDIIKERLRTEDNSQPGSKKRVFKIRKRLHISR
ncbi:MAG: tyrosine-type recombinase/integrase [Bacillota bacterium]